MTRTAFTGGLLLDGINPPQPDSTVVVEGQKIVSVNHDHNETGPADQVVQLNGATIMAGMVMGHYHAQMHDYSGTGGKLGIYTGTERSQGVLMAACIQAMRFTLMSGITGVVGGGCSDELDAQMKIAVEEGYCIGPRILPASHMLEATGYEGENVPWFRGLTNTGMYRFADGADAFLGLARDEIRKGAQMIKIQPTGGHGYPSNSGQGSIGAAPADSEVHRIIKLTKDEVAAVVTAAHDKGRKVRAHVAWRDQILMCAELGVDIIDHGDEMDAECLAVLGERGGYWCTSMTFSRRLIDNEDAPKEHRAAVERDYENVCKMIPTAVDSGVRILSGDDWGLSVIGMPHAVGAYAEELELWVNDAGVDPVDALRWATVNGASLLGVPGIGTLQEGSLADLLVVVGNPTQNVSLLRDPDRNIKVIMKDGSFVKCDLAGLTASVA
jgi:imidazolonepropionase-like amidohydrolase